MPFFHHVHHLRSKRPFIHTRRHVHEVLTFYAPYAAAPDTVLETVFLGCRVVIVIFLLK